MDCLETTFTQEFGWTEAIFQHSFETTFGARVVIAGGDATCEPRLETIFHVDFAFFLFFSYFWKDLLRILLCWGALGGVLRHLVASWGCLWALLGALGRALGALVSPSLQAASAKKVQVWCYSWLRKKPYCISSPASGSNLAC